MTENLRRHDLATELVLSYYAAFNRGDWDGMLATLGDEVIHDILDVMTAKLPYTAISRTMHIHPTVSELLPTLLQELTPLE